MELNETMHNKLIQWIREINSKVNDIKNEKIIDLFIGNINDKFLVKPESGHLLHILGYAEYQIKYQGGKKGHHDNSLPDFVIITNRQILH